MSTNKNDKMTKPVVFDVLSKIDEGGECTLEFDRMPRATKGDRRMDVNEFNLIMIFFFGRRLWICVSGEKMQRYR